MNQNLHWRMDRSTNFGDCLSPLIFSHLASCECTWVPENHPVPYLTLVGSFLHLVNANAVVWGTGLLDERHIPQPATTYTAVRGPLTRVRVVAAGGTCPEAYGDPAMLLPQIYPPVDRERRCLGIVPHFRERELSLFQQIDDPRVRVLDITSPPHEFVERLQQCEAVLSSSLHGLIAAHAYGIPAAWIQPTDRPLGDGMKFRDYFAAVDIPVSIGLRPTSAGDFAIMSSLALLPRTFLTPEFLEACPIDFTSISVTSSFWHERQARTLQFLKVLPLQARRCAIMMLTGRLTTHR